MLTGFMPPTEGKAQVAGLRRVRGLDGRRKRVGYLPERVPVYPDMTVRGYITFWAELRGVHRPRKQVDAVLDRVQLRDRQNSLIRNLSKGMRQRLGLAQALVHNPPVIILDEPTIGIDPQQVIEVREAVRELGADQPSCSAPTSCPKPSRSATACSSSTRDEILAEGKPS